MNFERHKRLCPICKNQIKGRSDKRFCSRSCKNYYHQKLLAINTKSTRKIDKILHRNRVILLELMGKHQKELRITRLELDKLKFNFNYFTSRTVNKQSKAYIHIYDFRYMLFSDANVIIYKGKK